MLFIRSLLFLLIKAALTVPFSLMILLAAPVPPLPRYRFITLWGRVVIWLARWVLGIRFRVEGRENLPQQPAGITEG